MEFWFLVQNQVSCSSPSFQQMLTVVSPRAFNPLTQPVGHLFCGSAGSKNRSCSVLCTSISAIAAGKLNMDPHTFVEQKNSCCERLKHFLNLEISNIGTKSCTRNLHQSGMEGVQWTSYCIILLRNQLHDQDQPILSTASSTCMLVDCCEGEPVKPFSM